MQMFDLHTFVTYFGSYVYLEINSVIITM